MIVSDPNLLTEPAAHVALKKSDILSWHYAMGWSRRETCGKRQKGLEIMVE